MNIELLTPDNGGQVRPLWLRALQDHPEAFGPTYEEQAAMPEERFAELLLTPTGYRYFLGAFVDGELAGLVGIGRDLREKLKHSANLGPMYVAPEYRGRGIGRALIDALAERARAAGVEQLKLSVTAGNASARHLYEACGFQEYGIDYRALRVGDVYHDLELMWRRL